MYNYEMPKLSWPPTQLKQYIHVRTENTENFFSTYCLEKKARLWLIERFTGQGNTGIDFR